MKVPLFNMPLEKMVKSKGMAAGFAAVAFGGWIASKGQIEFGWAVIIWGCGQLGIRDSNG